MSDRLYRLAAWLKLRRMKLQQDPLCEWCKRMGKLEPATDVDHIVPVSKGGEALDLEALQSLCHACHSRKTQRDMGNTSKPMKGLAPMDFHSTPHIRGTGAPSDHGSPAGYDRCLLTFAS